MAKGTCNDCASCIRSSASGCILGSLYWLYFLFGGFIFEIFATKCPKCGHRISSHATKFKAVSKRK